MHLMALGAFSPETVDAGCAADARVLMRRLALGAF